jgi:hypothetical protein
MMQMIVIHIHGCGFLRRSQVGRRNQPGDEDDE